MSALDENVQFDTWLKCLIPAFFKEIYHINICLSNNVVGLRYSINDVQWVCMHRLHAFHAVQTRAYH